MKNWKLENALAPNMASIAIYVVILLGLVSFPLTTVAQNLVSRPAGFVRVELPAGTQTLVSTPFVPFDNSVNAIFSGQLIGATDESKADKIFKWDATNGQYVTATKVDGTGNPQVDGSWFSDLASLTPSDMTIKPGEGFSILNHQDFMNIVYLSGQVALDPTNSVSLFPLLNLIGYPYSTPIALPDTSLLQGDAIMSGDALIDPTGELSLTNLLRMGKGYWYNRNSSNPQTWVEPQPYAGEAFPADGTGPMILGMIPSAGNGGMTLTIASGGADKLDVLYQDMDADAVFEPETGWLPADDGTNISVTGKQTIEWVDFGSTQRAPVSNVLARVYLIGRADIDSDGDGIPDVVTKFVRPSAAQTERQAASKPGRTIYVDAGLGDDNYDGLVSDDSAKAQLKGPKRTINAAIKAAAPGDVISVKEGIYHEDVSLFGVTLTTRGEVVIQ